MNSRAKGLFITGTDTEVGKTVVTGLLGKFLSDKGFSVITQKPIQTGSSAFAADIAAHLKLMGIRKKDVKEYLPYMAPYTFRFAASAHLAARAEKKKISAAKIKKSFGFLAKRFDFVIVEGIGGALVPFDNRKVLLDIISELKLPTVIVVKNRLGAINHTLLTIEALRARKMRISGIIFNSDEKKTDPVITKDNPEIIRALTGEKILGNLPWSKDQKRLLKAFMPVGTKILAELNRTEAK